MPGCPPQPPTARKPTDSWYSSHPRCRARLATPFLALLILLAFPASNALAAGDLNSPSCPFETEESAGFRSNLPDCRAYELTSPAFGAGAIMAGVGNMAPPMTPDGEHLLSVSFGPFAGTEELKQEGTGELGAFYELSRTPTGWSAEPQDPPATQYPFHSLQAWSATDLGVSVWKVPGPLAPGEAPEPYWFRQNSGQYVLREGRGHFTPVGPIVAPGHEVSADQTASDVRAMSDDAAHIIFSVGDEHHQLWPGDTTASGGSVYEYHGTAGGEPVLVGVANEGPPPWQASAAHLNEGASLLSQCGTEYDGTSTTGNLVFFTALAAHEEVAGQKYCAEGAAPASIAPPADEIYARVQGARTVEVSEPSSQACVACVIGPAQNATFVAASEDGTRVLFATEQKLLGAVNGESALNLYEYDFNAPEGERVRFIAPELQTLQPSREVFAKERLAVLSADGRRVYFQSSAVLTAAANGNGETAQAEREAGDTALLYTYDAEASPHVSFVAGARPREAGEEPFPYYRAQEPLPFKGLDATKDGEYLLFATATELRAAAGEEPDTSTMPQLFEYDAATGRVARVSIGQHSAAGFQCPSSGTTMEGYDCNGNTSSEEDSPRIALPAQGARGPVVSSVAQDGTVVFTSELPLAPGAVQGHQYFSENHLLQETAENVYEYRAGQVYLISPGDEALPAHYQAPKLDTRLFGIDRSGRNVFFSTVDSLVAQDTDTQSSWYDAREGGGFQAPASQPGCEGEACQGPGPAPPALSTPLAASAAAEDSPSSAIAPSPAKPKTAAQVRARALAKALKACRRLPGRRRHACEAAAKARYGPKKSSTRRKK